MKGITWQEMKVRATEREREREHPSGSCSFTPSESLNLLSSLQHDPLKMASCCLFSRLALLAAIVHFSCQLDLKNSDKIQFRSNPRNETYVLFLESRAEFTNASNMCSNFGTLAIVRDRTDQTFFQDWITNNDNSGAVWLGARYLAGQVLWQTLVAPSSQYTNWADREPYCANQCCAVLFGSNGKWATFPCSYKARVLCKLNSNVEQIIANSTEAPASEERTENSVQPEILNQWIVRVAEMESKVERMLETISDLKVQLELEQQARINETATFNRIIQVMREDFRSSMNALECQMVNGGKNKC